MKALVTGAAGFVGPHLQHLLRAEGDDVVGVDTTGGPDLADPEGWEALMVETRPDVVYHLAGWSDVGGSWDHPRSTFDVNVMGTISVLEAARAARVGRLIMVSSADVYGTVVADDLPITEEHPVRPRSPYGASKQAAEAAALQYHRGHGLEVVVVRPFNHIGPGQSPRFAVPAFARQIAAAEAVAPAQTADPTVLRHGDLSPQRDLTDVRDVVRAYRLLARNGRPGQVYNVCSGRSASMASVLETLLSLTSAPVETEVDPERLRPVEIPMLRGSFDRLAQATGWRPTIDLATSLADVLDDARAHRDRPVHADDPSTG